jgi:hypothetical protein
VESHGGNRETDRSSRIFYSGFSILKTLVMNRSPIRVPLDEMGGIEEVKAAASHPDPRMRLEKRAVGTNLVADAPAQARASGKRKSVIPARFQPG